MHLHLVPEDGVETEDGGAHVPFLAPEPEAASSSAASRERSVEAAAQRARSKGSRADSGAGGDEKARLFSKERIRSLSKVYEPDNIPTNSAALSTFLLLNAMIGSGILNQPYVFMKSGIIGALFAFVLAAGMTWLGLMLLTKCAMKVNYLEYSGLAGKVFGKRGETVVDIAIIIQCFGSLLGYILVVGQTLSDLFDSWGCHSDACGTLAVTALAVSICVTPFCLFRHFGHFAWISIFSIIAIVAVLLLVMIGGPLNQKEGKVLAFSLPGTLQSIGSIVFALSCASSNLQAFVSTERVAQNSSSWRGVTGGAVGMGAVMCVVMGLCGYLAFRDDTEGEILDNFESNAYDFFKIMVVVHLILYIPINFVVMRYSLVKIATGKRSETLDFWPHTLLSLGLLAFSTIVVLLLNEMGVSGGEGFGLILSITGGVGGSLSSFIIPAALFIKLSPKTDRLYYPAYVLFALGWLILLGVVVETIVSSAS